MFDVFFINIVNKNKLYILKVDDNLNNLIHIYFFNTYLSGMGQHGQCITYEAINQAYINARKRISKFNHY